MELGTHLPFQSEFILDDRQPDLALRSSDDAVFWTHRVRLNAVSQNAFDGLLDTYSKNLTSLDPVVPLPISSSLLSVVLYTIYDLPFPTTLNDLQLSTLLDALSVLKTYGIPLDHFIVPARSLYEAILAETPSNPMEVYITAFYLYGHAGVAHFLVMGCPTPRGCHWHSLHTNWLHSCISPVMHGSSRSQINLPCMRELETGESPAIRECQWSFASSEGPTYRSSS